MADDVAVTVKGLRSTPVTLHLSASACTVADLKRRMASESGLSVFTLLGKSGRAPPDDEPVTSGSVWRFVGDSASISARRPAADQQRTGGAGGQEPTKAASPAAASLLARAPASLAVAAAPSGPCVKVLGLFATPVLIGLDAADAPRTFGDLKRALTSMPGHGIDRASGISLLAKGGTQPNDADALAGHGVVRVVRTAAHADAHALASSVAEIDQRLRAAESAMARLEADRRTMDAAGWLLRLRDVQAEARALLEWAAMLPVAADADRTARLKRLADDDR